jgi:predicted enzyme related to lactoylglutathione lyase
MYRVDDLDGAIDAVRAISGTATDPDSQPYGRTSLCTDDQGTSFYLGEMR